MGGSGLAPGRVGWLAAAHLNAGTSICIPITFIRPARGAMKTRRRVKGIITMITTVVAVHSGADGGRGTLLQIR